MSCLFPSVACLELSNYSNLVIFFSFVIEVYWLFCHAVFSWYIYTTGKEGYNSDCILPSHFESVAMATCLDMAMIFLIFCEVLWVLIQVIYV